MKDSDLVGDENDVQLYLRQQWNEKKGAKYVSL